MRQPSHSLIIIPVGTPATIEPLIPTNMIPMARPRIAGVTNSVASIVAIRQTAALAIAIPIRAANRTP